MNKTYVKALLVLLAVVLLGGSYLYIFKPKQDDTESINAEADQLEARYNELSAKKAHEEEYKQLTAQYNAQFDEILTHYPGSLAEENTIMFIKGLTKDEGDLQFDIRNVGLGAPSEFYTIGGETEYSCKVADFPLSYRGSYEGLKDFVDYVMDFDYRMNIDSFNISYDVAEDVYAGSINLHAYSVEGGDQDGVIAPADVDVPKGVDNPFLGGEGAPAAAASVHDADNGASIAGNHDIQIEISNANNDATAGIIVSGGDDDVTSEDNKVVTVDVTIEDDAVTYAIGSDSSTYKLPGSATEVTIFVKSSARVDADDTNGVKLNVTNNSTKSAYIKVADDDSESPRFAMGSRSGKVKLY